MSLTTLQVADRIGRAYKLTTAQTTRLHMMLDDPDGYAVPAAFSERKLAQVHVHRTRRKLAGVLDIKTEFRPGAGKGKAGVAVARYYLTPEDRAKAGELAATLMDPEPKPPLGLTPSEFAIHKALLTAPPSVMRSRNQLAQAVTSVTGRQTSCDAVDVMLCKMRPKLKLAGVRLISQYQQGWRYDDESRAKLADLATIKKGMAR